MLSIFVGGSSGGASEIDEATLPCSVGSTCFGGVRLLEVKLDSPPPLPHRESKAHGAVAAASVMVTLAPTQSSLASAQLVTRIRSFSALNVASMEVNSSVSPESVPIVASFAVGVESVPASAS